MEKMLMASALSSRAEPGSIFWGKKTIDVPQKFRDFLYTGKIIIGSKKNMLTFVYARNHVRISHSLNYVFLPVGQEQTNSNVS